MKRTLFSTLLAFSAFSNPLFVNDLSAQSAKLTEVILNKGHVTPYALQDFSMTCDAVDYRTGIPSELLFGIAVHETGYFSSELAKNAFNYFGIMALRDWEGHPVYEMKHSIRIGKTTRFELKSTPFRMYNNISESVYDFPLFIQNSRYDAAWECGEDVVCWLEKLHAAGYSQDPNWAAEITELLVRYEMLSLEAPRAKFVKKR